MTNKNITAVILCGGKSSRIGKNKAFLKIGDRTFIEILINKLGRLFRQIIISTKDTIPYKHLESPRACLCRRHGRQVIIARDKSKILGSLVGIYSALRKSNTKYIFVIAVDMPTVETGLIKRLIKYCRGYDVVIPQTRKGLEPLCAVYSKKCISPIARQIRSGNYKIIDFFEQARVKTIRLKKNGLFNVNTPDDYRTCVTGL